MVDDVRGRGPATLGFLIGCTVAMAAGGCVERVVSITSEPPGALVYLNDREIGRTPVETRFVHYGTFDVRLLREGFEPLATVGEAKAPLWDTVPLDFVATILPLPLESRIRWHYDLEPVRDEADGMVERAMGLRQRVAEPMPGFDEAEARIRAAGEAEAEAEAEVEPNAEAGTGDRG